MRRRNFGVRVEEAGRAGADSSSTRLGAAMLGFVQTRGPRCDDSLGRTREAQKYQLVGETQMVANRREMLGHAAGAAVVFLGCGLSPASAQARQRRREGVDNGKRVRTVDV